VADFERDHPGDMHGQLKAWLICAEECVTSDERGCDLANAAVELTADVTRDAASSKN